MKLLTFEDDDFDVLIFLFVLFLLDGILLDVDVPSGLAASRATGEVDQVGPGLGAQTTLNEDTRKSSQIFE